MGSKGISFTRDITVLQNIPFFQIHSPLLAAVGLGPFWPAHGPAQGRTQDFPKRARSIMELNAWKGSATPALKQFWRLAIFCEF